ncbi:hypothetical protein GP486_005959 [Trichoglossum hirsutum]|uniref:AB hydrolase-1 domain-containing protein n=1 Tax=Trichoglossum hirsutum TaxID=265104 RepID=A0A9P8RLR7_9PEZI|nr:hypothetical protein GP486_005959 [Trichoglossum hirsutum]
MKPSNASSLPPRLPFLSQVLQRIKARENAAHQTTKVSQQTVRYTTVGLSYRGFWTSEGRPSQRGIVLDVLAALDWIQFSYGEARIILWGQSIGAGVASVTAARHLRSTLDSQTPEQGSGSDKFNISGMILETPFTSMGDMLVALYPQRWLPYRYLKPFLRSRWDSRAALKEIAQLKTHSVAVGKKTGGDGLKILILQAGRDELVPREHGIELQNLGASLGLDVRRKEIGGALHTEAMMRDEGRRVVADFLVEVAGAKE